MQTQNFKASVQYGDMTGTVAVDRRDKGNADQWLQDRNLKQEGEFLLGITFYAGENHGAHKDPISVEFLLTTPGDHDNVKAMIDASTGPVLVRRVRQSMPVTEFFGLFKRFSLNFSSHGMLNGREYTFVDY